MYSVKSAIEIISQHESSHYQENPVLLVFPFNSCFGFFDPLAVDTGNRVLMESESSFEVVDSKLDELD